MGARTVRASAVFDGGLERALASAAADQRAALGEAVPGETVLRERRGSFAASIVLSIVAGAIVGAAFSGSFSLTFVLSPAAVTDGPRGRGVRSDSSLAAVTGLVSVGDQRMAGRAGSPSRYSSEAMLCRSPRYGRTAPAGDRRRGEAISGPEGTARGSRRYPCR